MIKIFCDACGKEINPETEGFCQFEGRLVHESYYECRYDFNFSNTPSILEVKFTDAVIKEFESHRPKPVPIWREVLGLFK